MKDRENTSIENNLSENKENVMSSEKRKEMVIFFSNLCLDVRFFDIHFLFKIQSKMTHCAILLLHHPHSFLRHQTHQKWKAKEDLISLTLISKNPSNMVRITITNRF